PGTARLVIELHRKASYRIEPGPTGLAVVLDASVGAPAEGATAPPASAPKQTTMSPEPPKLPAMPKVVDLPKAFGAPRPPDAPKPVGATAPTDAPRLSDPRKTGGVPMPVDVPKAPDALKPLPVSKVAAA